MELLKKPITKYIPLLLVILSLISLAKTSSFFSVYLVLGLLAIVLDIVNLKNKGFLVTFQRRNLLLNCTGVFFTLCIVLANYNLWTLTVKSVITLLFTILGSLHAARTILYFFCDYASRSKVSVPKASPLKFAIIMFLCSSIINLVYLFLFNYPGNLSPDSLSQIDQILRNDYVNHHPYWHTMLIKAFFSIGYSLFGNINAGICTYNVFQLLFMASVFSYAIYTLAQCSCPKTSLIICILFFSLMPYNITYSITVWKNIPFSLCVLTYIISLYRFCIRKNKKILHVCLCFLSGLGICIFQSNGWIAFIIASVIFFVTYRKENFKITLTNIFVLLASYVMLHTLLNRYEVTRGDFIESLSIPCQQVARVIKDGENISENEKEELEKVTSLELVKSEYLNYISDPIKVLVRLNGDQDYLINHKSDFLKIWLNIGLKNPRAYLKAWIDQTKGYWNGGYSYWVSVTGADNDYMGTQRTSVFPKAADAINGFLKDTFEDSFFFDIFHSIGLCTWILIGCLVINLSQKKYCYAFLSVPPLSVVITLLIATPVSYEFRYAYSLFLCLPFILSITLSGRRSLSKK